MLSLFAVLALCAAAQAQSLPVPSDFNPTVIDPQTEVFIGFKWDPNLPNVVSNGIQSDFDLVAWNVDEDCKIYNKGAYGGTTCWGLTEGFGAMGPFNAQFIHSSGMTFFTQYDTATYPWDSKSNSGGGSSSRAGMEGLIISGGYKGVFRIAVYDYTSTTNGNFARSPSVTGLRAKIYVGLTNVSALDITPPSSTSCLGRFWNIATLNITSTSPLAYTLTSVNTISRTPLTTFGTTATQSFERGAPGTPSRPGTTAACGA